MTILHHRTEGSGPTVVLLHAGVADLRMWDTQVEELTVDHTVVRCDLRGYGRSPLVPGSGDAEDVLALLDDLAVDTFALVGASYGGFVALQVASAVPERLEKLVLLDPAAEVAVPDDRLREFWRREGELLEAGDLDGATDLNVATWLGPDAADDHRELLWRMQRNAFDLQTSADDGDEDHELPVDLDRITAPTTVVVGGLDLPFFRDTARILVERLPRAELVELPWAAHLPSLERPFETAHLVRASLE
jgi:pimeloyl-ACP methyl ester carboxylesterase